MYRSSSACAVLFVLLSVAAVCNGAPIHSNQRHDPSKHGSDASPVAEKPTEMPMEDNGGNQDTKMPESDMDSGDQREQADSDEMTESDMNSENQMEQGENDEMTVPEMNPEDQMEQSSSPEMTEAGMGSEDQKEQSSSFEITESDVNPEDHSSHEHESNSGDKPKREKPSVEGGSHDNKPDDGEMAETGIDVDSEDSESTFLTSSDEPEPSPVAASGVCIAANMLGNFTADELVFEKHVLARVICDGSGSCATKGHIVYYKGKAMMMASYCDIIGCNESIMEVNSPKYSRGLKVQSKSMNMHFTAFAAKYETRGEEALLSAAVHMGL